MNSFNYLNNNLIVLYIYINILGADVNLKNKLNQSPRDIALEYGNQIALQGIVPQYIYIIHKVIYTYI